MASILLNCTVCGRAVRFPEGQTAPASVVCENPACIAEIERREKVNAPPEKKAPAEKKATRGR